MAAVTSPETSPQPRVYFQTVAAGSTEEPEIPVRKQGRVTVKYDRKELRKRLNLEEWIIDQLTALYNCEEEAIPELEIDVDELLDMPSDDDRGARVKDLLIDCYKPTEDFVSGLLDKIRGMQKLTTPQKK
ncbi:protein phosphatase 1 regulatory subunit 14B-like [Oncorhynchus keta]|uniref:protein phosphatase 1 regulatory subunit 14B-like n=1 Tax=Oncorhynchus gorbuscha TaxID=8017 RepID=UPI001EAF7D43|nr:protein phosphatase 1 regulatory subunit 14B-like [Oncorhynchus gorbuscha]XP_052353733.1 protein phosphatase 1 regulatory subunit 14B-like [Oncorhynchus keta]